MNTLFSKAGICNNQYSDEVKRLLKVRDIEIRKIGEGKRSWRNLNLTLKQLKEEVKKERKQWLKDTLEERKKETIKKEQKKLNSIFDEYFN